MGYYSTIRNFDQFEFKLSEGITEEKILGILDGLSAGYGEELKLWFDFTVDEEGNLKLEPYGEEGKAYYLEPALKALIGVLEELQSSDDSSGLRGIRFRFELWGEEAGDARLYLSDGKQLLAAEGKITFPDEPKPA